jgi:hypothetical protein
VSVDDSGNIYIVEPFAIKKVTASTGIINTIAGDGTAGFGCEGCDASQAKFIQARAIAFDKAGNYYIADKNNSRIRKVDKTTNIITTFAGTTGGYSGDGGPATSAQLGGPVDICFDTSGNMYIADVLYVIRRVDAVTGIITTIAGNGIQGAWTNGQLALNAKLGTLTGLCTDAKGNIYFSDADSYKIGKINTAGVVSTYAGDGTLGLGGDGGPATAAQLFASGKIKFDPYGDLVIADRVIRRVNNVNGFIEKLAGNGISGYSGDNGPALQAQFNGPVGIAFDSTHNIFVADSYNFRIRRIAGVTSTDGDLAVAKIDFYPNPSTGRFKISSPEIIDRVQIRNFLGQLIYRADASTDLVYADLSDQPNGVYVISICSGQRVVSQKVVVHH